MGAMGKYQMFNRGVAHDRRDDEQAEGDGAGAAALGDLLPRARHQRRRRTRQGQRWTDPQRPDWKCRAVTDPHRAWIRRARPSRCTRRRRLTSSGQSGHHSFTETGQRPPVWLTYPTGDTGPHEPAPSPDRRVLPLLGCPAGRRDVLLVHQQPARAAGRGAARNRDAHRRADAAHAGGHDAGQRSRRAPDGHAGRGLDRGGSGHVRQIRHRDQPTSSTRTAVARATPLPQAPAAPCRSRSSTSRPSSPATAITATRLIHVRSKDRSPARSAKSRCCSTTSRCAASADSAARILRRRWTTARGTLPSRPGAAGWFAGVPRARAGTRRQRARRPAGNGREARIPQDVQGPPNDGRRGPRGFRPDAPPGTPALPERRLRARWWNRAADPTHLKMDLTSIRRELFREMAPNGTFETMTPEERQRVGREVNQRLLGIVQGLQLSAAEIQKKAEAAKQQADRRACRINGRGARRTAATPIVGPCRACRLRRSPLRRASPHVPSHPPRRRPRRQ